MIIISIFFIIIIVDIDTATWEVESTFTVGTPEMTFRLIFLKGQWTEQFTFLWQKPFTITVRISK